MIVPVSGATPSVVSALNASVVPTNPLNQAGGGSTSATAPTSQLGEGDFLKLLVAQLKYQDPLNPVSGTQFMAQTAQFSQVEQLTTLATLTGQMLSAQQMTEASTMIGRTVTYADPSGSVTSGTVSSVVNQAGSAPLLVLAGNGTQVPLTSVTGVGAIAGASPAAAGSTGTPSAGSTSSTGTSPSAPSTVTTA
ncbi:MAG: flagellar hook capping FlgD N-terminal domain-containing protein [Actinomycetes bacterium]